MMTSFPHFTHGLWDPLHVMCDAEWGLDYYLELHSSRAPGVSKQSEEFKSHVPATTARENRKDFFSLFCTVSLTQSVHSRSDSLRVPLENCQA